MIRQLSLLVLCTLLTSCDTLTETIKSKSDIIITNQDKIGKKLPSKYRTRVQPLLTDTQNQAVSIKKDADDQAQLVKDKDKAGVIFWLTLLIPISIVTSLVLGYFGMKELAMYCGLLATVCIAIITYYSQVIIIGSIIGVAFILKIGYSAYHERKLKRGLKETVASVSVYRDKLDADTKTSADRVVKSLQSKSTHAIVHQEKMKNKIKKGVS